MKCPRCGFKNDSTNAYCRKCGGKMDVTADEIRASLLEKAHGERTRMREHYARQALYFAVVVFLISVTFLFLAGGDLRDTRALPSAIAESRYGRFTYSIQDDLDLQKGLVPFAAERR